MDLGLTSTFSFRQIPRLECFVVDLAIGFQYALDCGFWDISYRGVCTVQLTVDIPEHIFSGTLKLIAAFAT
jgi:hypothetical protein